MVRMPSAACTQLETLKQRTCKCTCITDMTKRVPVTAGTLVHYPTVADPLEAVWKDDHGSISGQSARKGVNIYTDQAGTCLC